MHDGGNPRRGRIARPDARLLGLARAQVSTGISTLNRLPIIAAVIFAIGTPTSGLAGDLTITQSIRVSETVTDNVDLDTSDGEESALITEITPTLRIRSASARVTGALNANPTIRHQTGGTDKGLTVDERLTGLGTVEVLEDLFFLEAQASVSQQVLDSRAAATAANQETVQTYRLSPVLRNRFGNFANSETRYALSQTFVGGQGGAGGVSDSMRHNLNFRLSSGRDFTRLLWSLSASASQSDRPDAEDVSRGEVNSRVEYVFDRSFSVIGSVGYQLFDDGQSANEIESPTWRAGFRWRPGPRTELEATYGERDDAQNLFANFRYDIGPRTTLRASYTEILETSQERLARTLSFIDLEGETDDFIDERTEDEFDPNPSPFDIDNVTTRITTLSAGLRGTRGRNTFAVDASIEKEEAEPTGEEQDVIRASARWSRRLNPHLRLSVFGAYENTKFDDGQEDDEYTAIATLSYDLYKNVQAALNYGFRLQNSTVDASEFAENRITVSARVTF